MTGLSPRARGNVDGLLSYHQFVGSIPASAGERESHSGRARLCGVYPRERGGTCDPALRLATAWGLSPRARGNGSNRTEARDNGGSIPASAGERYGLDSLSCATRVYPRERGGTATTLPPRVYPRERGGTNGVYPRERGGTQRGRDCGR